MIVMISTQGVVSDAYADTSRVTCVVITNPVESKLTSDYIVTINPPHAKVVPGDVITFDVTILAKDNTKDFISLDILGLPEEINASFEPNHGSTDFTSKLMISVDEMICPGIYAPTIIAQDTNVQLADFKLEVAGVDSVRKAMEGEIAELSSKIDDLEQTIREIKSNSLGEGRYASFSDYVTVMLVAIIGSFLLGAFALYVLLRYSVKNPTSEGNQAKIQEIKDLLKESKETRRQVEETNVRDESPQERRKEQSLTEPKPGDVWYASCSICGLRTEHCRDYEGVFCARCGSRST